MCRYNLNNALNKPDFGSIHRKFPKLVELKTANVAVYGTFVMKLIVSLFQKKLK